jgi:hypothetical protein
MFFHIKSVWFSEGVTNIEKNAINTNFEKKNFLYSGKNTCCAKM